MIGRNGALNSHFNVEKCIMCSHSFANCCFFADAKLIGKRVSLADSDGKYIGGLVSKHRVQSGEEAENDPVFC